jgi:hypothetical protein
LLADRDDEFVILHHGDEISVNFQYLPGQEGIQRDFFLYSWGYYKGRDYATGNTVEPLPFHGMSSYPYPSNESYPSDIDHLAYLKTYNTRQYSDQGDDSGPIKHRTIYTDYVKVDVSTVELSTTRVVEKSPTSVVETSTTGVVEASTTGIVGTSTTNVEVVTNLVTLTRYLALVGLAAIVVSYFAIRRIRKT